ncbi:MAG: serine-type D-Ala-D-Ala carboxypeptidase, partial [Mucilaginibacter sp.]|nr:serine-type D-Ala-D-Ala carboxypeptidase [Mucilaginibacter sp.]
MIRNRRSSFLLVLLAITLLHSACAQSPGMEYVKEEQKVAQSIVLLNNDKYLVPLQNIAELKIASVHFSARFANGFDSLLN